MKIEITRSGGMAGLTRTWSLEVSTTEVEQRWLPLAGTDAEGSEAGSGSAGAIGGKQGPGRHRDAFTYRIAIGRTEIYFSEDQLEGPWRELIERARADGGRPGMASVEPSTDGGSKPGKPEELL